jgi:hypothetical protein
MGRTDYLQDDLRAQWRSLQSSWQATREKWRDGISSQFEREFWNQWQTEAPRIIKAFDELNAVLEKALRRTE